MPMLGYQGKVIEYDQPIIAKVVDGAVVSKVVAPDQTRKLKIAMY